MIAAARGQTNTATGLETWWLPEQNKPISVTFDWKFSVRTMKMKIMLRDLLFYRLGLGQPEPEQFVEMLKKIDASPEQARALAIDLSAIAPILRREREAFQVKSITLNDGTLISQVSKISLASDAVGPEATPP
jgi:hypothetical protein